MDQAHPKYFDYLDVDKYREFLIERFEIKTLADDIHKMRERGYSEPEYVCIKSGKTAELMTKSLIKKRFGTPKLKELQRGHNFFLNSINYLRQKKIISESYADKYHTLRKNGNTGKHDPVQHFDDAKNSMIALDEILRKEVSGFDSAVISSISIKDDEDDIMFTCPRVDEQKAERVTVATGDPTLEKEAKETNKKLEKQSAKISDKARILSEMQKQLSELEEDEGADEEIEETRSKIKTQFEKDVIDKAQEIKAKQTSIEDKVEQLLSEEDTIKMLLDGNGEATKEQLRVLAFPKGANATSTILNIAGSAGTGKTYCLIAKLMKEIRDDIEASKQLNMFGQAPKRALFVCYNKNLEKHIQGLVQSEALQKNYPGVSDRIDVVRFHQFVNQLAGPHTKQKYGKYAHDVRYPSGYELSYSRNLLEQAMETCSFLYPDKSTMRYLDKKKSSNVNWMQDEIDQLEAHYEDPDVAKAPYLEKRNWSNAGRRPNENARKAILEVWKLYRELLIKEDKFILEQAVKRLMKSNELPKYDFIAVDEAQDLNLSHIRLLWALRVSPTEPRMYIAGDEKQRIYKRNYKWKDIEDGAAGYTITLGENKRNSPSVAKFANRLLQEPSTREECSEGVEVSQKSQTEVLDYVRKFAKDYPNETTVLVGKPQEWCPKVKKAGMSLNNPFISTRYGSEQKTVDFVEPGLFVTSEFASKGLEFDNVVIANMNEVKTDEETDENLKYVNFTRARKRLSVFYDGEPPELLKKYYSDFLLTNH